MFKHIKKIFDRPMIDKYVERGSDEICHAQRFFEEQAKLPPLMRSNFAYISCSCKHCNPYTL